MIHVLKTFILTAVFASVIPAAQAHAQATDLRTRCEARLRNAICETSADSREIQRGYNTVACTRVKTPYLQTLMGLYDELPSKLRLTLCTVDRVFISDRIAQTAFSNVLYGQNNPNVPVAKYFGFRKATFTTPISLDRLVTWKDQLAFGGSQTFLSNDPSLSQIRYGLRLATPVSTGLFYVLIHELAHLVDRTNRITENSATGSWNTISWQSSSAGGRTLFEAKPAHKYTYQSRFCVYRCETVLSPAMATDIYTSLARSGFITTYAGTLKEEDFAEFFTWYVLKTQKQSDYRITLRGGQVVNMNTAFEANPIFRAKFQFIHRLWNDPATEFNLAR